MKKKNQQKSLNLSYSKAKSRQTLADVTTGLDSNLIMQFKNIFLVDNINEALILHSKLKEFESVITPCGIWLGSNWLKMPSLDKKTNVISKRA